MTQQSAITNERLEFRLGSFHSTELLKKNLSNLRQENPVKLWKISAQMANFKVTTTSQEIRAYTNKVIALDSRLIK